MLLDEEGRYTLLFSGRRDGRGVEGVGLALSPQAREALRHHQSISARILTAEFLTRVGPLMIVVAYAPTRTMLKRRNSSMRISTASWREVTGR